MARFTGTPGDDITIGTDRGDIVRDGGGDDYADGRGGNDQIHGGTGDDTIWGGTGFDLLWGNEGDDSLNGDGGDKLRGNEGNDLLVHEGGQGRAWINAGAGDDVVLAHDGDVYGDRGNDYLSMYMSDASGASTSSSWIRGNSGADTFALTAVADGQRAAAMVNDFKAEEGDHLHLEGQAWDAASQTVTFFDNGSIMAGLDRDGDGQLSEADAGGTALGSVSVSFVDDGHGEEPSLTLDFLGDQIMLRGHDHLDWSMLG